MAAVLKMTEDTLDNRVTRLESDVAHIRTDVAEIKFDLRQVHVEIVGLRDKMDDGFKELGGQIAALRDQTDQKISGLREETHSGFKEVRGEIAGLRDKMDMRFDAVANSINVVLRWQIGLIITIVLSAAGYAMDHWSQLDRSVHGVSNAAISLPQRPATPKTP